jgi:hypothetical protein
VIERLMAAVQEVVGVAERLTADELATIRARCDAATPGPWLAGRNVETNRWSVDAFGRFEDGTLYGMVIARPSVDNGEANATFITNARTDVPRLLDEIERLRAERDAAVAREFALAEALETLLNEQNDVPLFTREKEWRTACQRGWAMIVDPSPAAKRHMERVVALDRVAALAGVVRDKAAYGPYDDSAASVREWDDLVAAVDALRALDGDPRA